jgi:hypothetical protein
MTDYLEFYLDPVPSLGYLFHGSLSLRIIGSQYSEFEGKIFSSSFHLTGMDTVAETDGLAAKTEAIVFTLAF